MQDKNEAVVKGEAIVKTFKDFWGRDKVKALKGVDIVIPKGSVFGLLGPNGAGKSTLIKLILGHLYPTSGRIAVLGKDPKDVETKYKIGYMPERSYLYKNLTAEETLFYFGEILNLSRDQIKSRSDQLLEMVGLQHAKKRYVGEFSHGMTRRMGLAQALLNDPDFIILDEPTAGLDPVGCREVKDLIITLGKRGKTILLTSHLLADVEDTCDELLTMYGGTVQSKGKIDDLLADTNRIKLEFPANKGIDVTAIEQELKQKSSGDFSISSPRQSLEQYFLNIVNKGRQSKETSGAQKGKGVAAYLKAGVEEEKAAVEEDASIPIQTLKDLPVQSQRATKKIEEKSEFIEGSQNSEKVNTKTSDVDHQVREESVEIVEESSVVKEERVVDDSLNPDIDESSEVAKSSEELHKVEVEIPINLEPDLDVNKNKTSFESVEGLKTEVAKPEFTEKLEFSKEVASSDWPDKTAGVVSEFSDLKASSPEDEIPVEVIDPAEDEEDSDLDEKLLDDLTI